MSKLGMENTVLRTEFAELRRQLNALNELCLKRGNLILALTTQNEELRSQNEALRTENLALRAQQQQN